MKKLTLATSVALAAMAAPTLAADLEMDRELGLIVSGISDSWVGAQFLDRGPFSDKTVLAFGGAGMLSLPLGDNLSIQNDFKYEYNDQASESVSAGSRFSYQFAGHLSWRDPGAGLFGVFGGAGTSNAGGVGDNDIAFIGGEFQFYLDQFTLYGQGGYVDYSNALSGNKRFDGLDHGYFARGVVRWFVTDDSRFQFEGTYFNSDFARYGDTSAYTIGARYDFMLGVPIIGDTSLYVAWRGQWRQDCLYYQGGNVDINDHTIMIGSRYSFSGDLLTVDRQGATLDTPDFNHGCVSRSGSSSGGSG